MIEKTFKTDDDTSIYYRIFGEENKKTLLLIHGWVTDGRCYEKLIPFLSKKFRLIVPDLRGFGKSEKKGPFVTSRMAKDMMVLYDIENVESVAGHSWGGLISQIVAAFKKPSSLILISTFAKWSKPFYGWFLKRLLGLIETEKESFVERISNIVYGSQIDPKTLEILKELDREILKESAEDILTYDNTNNLSVIDSKTLIVHGMDDRIVPVKHAYYLNERIRNSEMILFPNTTHNILSEKPELLSSVIVGWIENL